MVVVAQLVRALDCGSRGRRFEPGLPPSTSEKVPILLLGPCFFGAVPIQEVEHCHYNYRTGLKAQILTPWYV